MVDRISGLLHLYQREESDRRPAPRSYDPGIVDTDAYVENQGSIPLYRALKRSNDPWAISPRS